MSRDPDSYDVGYRKPPRHTQFQKGQSGNPGRKRGSKSLSNQIMDELRKKITITDANGRRRVTKQEAMVIQMVNKGLAGDHKAAMAILQVDRQREAEAARGGGAEPFTLANDLTVALALLKRMHGDTPEPEGTSDEA